MSDDAGIIDRLHVSAAHKTVSFRRFIIGSDSAAVSPRPADGEGPYRVGVIEAGSPLHRRPVRQDELASAEVRLRHLLGLLGIQRIHLLKDVMILAGSGVGGGSLNYANTSCTPIAVLQRQTVGHITDWGQN